VPEPEYSVQGYAFSAITHATAHKVPAPKRNISFFCNTGT